MYIIIYTIIYIINKCFDILYVITLICIKDAIIILIYLYIV